ncbi:acyltransferase family protein [Escherichia coli]|uniref:acyltransferase family protein n=1 Tax=Escherichia coli TaxID=562 RepID=UPI003FD29950
MGLFSSTEKTQSKFYQPEVDGLRAVAVLLVLFFHAGFKQISGGYIGVDVFFVISGFLITGIIYNSLEKNKFSYVNFLFFRCSRLYPALLATILLCLLFGFLIYNPQDYKLLSDAALYSTFSASNFYFMNSAGYFDTSSTINPLLHTWSLAVEQQFYLVWPAVILIAFKINKKIVPALVIIIGLISLALSQYWIEVNSSQNFYMVPFRIFEFSIGASVFFYRDKIKLSNAVCEILFIVGIAMIIYSAIYFNSVTAFPGVNALIPSIGAAMCIIFSNGAKSAYIIKNKVAVSLGIVSYSIYLIHWPIMVFYKYYVFRDIDNIEKSLLVIVPIALSFLMYYFIENKYRRINIKSVSSSALCFYAVLVALATFSYTAITNGGYPDRIADKTKYFADKFKDPKMFHWLQYGGYGYYKGTHVIGDFKADKVSAVIFGDSFSRQFAHVMDDYYKKNGVKVLTVFQDGCIFSEKFAPVYAGKTKLECRDRLRTAINYSKSHNIPIVWSNNWPGYSETIGDFNGKTLNLGSEDAYKEKIFESISDLVSAVGDNHVYIIGAPPGTGGLGSIQDCLYRPEYLPLACANSLTTDINGGDKRKFNLFIKDFVKRYKNVTFIDPYDYLCDGKRCSTMTSDYKFIYSDAQHLSIDGSSIVWDKIKKIINL